MDRIINVKVGGNYLSKDNKNAGVRGEANVTLLRITFDEGWDGYAKKVTFWNARGLNPVVVYLLPTMEVNPLTYLVPIPKEPLEETGKMTFVIEGEIEGKVQRSLSDELEVKDSPTAENAAQPIAPTPDELGQIRGELEDVRRDIQDAVQAKKDSEEALSHTRTYSSEASGAKEQAETLRNQTSEYARQAAESANLATGAVGKTSYIGENGNWYAWDSTTGVFYDTGVKAQSGSTVYYGDNPPAEADVWINPDGEGRDYYTKDEVDQLVKERAVPSYAYINILGGEDNWDAEDVTNASGEVVGVRYGQTVNVNNAVITERSKVDLQISSEQMVIFYQKGIAFVTENDEGVVTVYCVGKIPENDYTIPVVITEVALNG